MLKRSFYIFGITLFVFISCKDNSNETESVETISHESEDTLATIDESQEPVYIVDTLEQKLIDAGLVNVQEVVPEILIDLRYSTTNNFMHQEPGSDEEIKKFCDLRFKVRFPLFSKISVKGKDIHPLFAYLTSQPGLEGDVSWNFNKFLVDSEGKVVARYGSRTKPGDKELITQIEKALSHARV